MLVVYINCVSLGFPPRVRHPVSEPLQQAIRHETAYCPVCSLLMYLDHLVGVLNNALAKVQDIAELKRGSVRI